jgi:hypothetical protein
MLREEAPFAAREVLRTYLGYSEAEIEQLRTTEAI